MLKRLAGRLFKRAGYHLSRDHGNFGNLPFVKASAGDVILDVGAHLGDTVAELRHHFPAATIHAFEPFAEFNQRTTARYEQDAAVHVHGIALSDRAGTAPFVTSDFNLSLAGPLKVSTSETTYIDVAVDTLDAWAARSDVKHVKLMKIDAEGHDLAVLRGAEGLIRSGAIDGIVVEVMFIPLIEGQPLFNDIYSHLAERGYVLFDVRQVKKASDGQSRYANAVFKLV